MSISSKSACICGRLNCDQKDEDMVKCSSCGFYDHVENSQLVEETPEEEMYFCGDCKTQ